VPGRFNAADQRASYCANNIILCFAEMLYHMYRMFLLQLEQYQPKVHSKNWITQNSRLVIFSVKRIDDLVYADSIGAKQYDARITSSTVVSPDHIYGPLHNLSERARQAKKSGVVYPSARHSQDFAFVFFKNETQKLMETPYRAPHIILQLIAEDQDTSSFPPKRFKVYTDKLHATMGYYQFKNPAYLDSLKKAGLIYPEDIPLSGYVDFVRRRYVDYPKCAVRP
jgi:RES domain-containing protein